MAAPAAAPLCRVCGEHAAEYTCPRCNARYCSLDCYKRHSDRCTEGFYRDAAVSELRSIRAGEDEQRRMADILQRLYQQEVEGGGSGSDSEEEEGEEEGAGGLSVETLHRLLAKMEASGGRLDIGAEDLSPAELAAFHRALAAGELSSAVQPWQPWWLSEEAASLELSAAGTPLVAAVGEAAEQQPGQQGPSSGSIAAASSSGQPPAGGAAAAAVQGSGLPPPPSRPLPPLAALTKAAPSPLLRWQLLDLLYAYCFTLRLYNGDYGWEAADAADVLFALSAVLAATPAAAAGAAGQQSSSSGGEDAAAGAAAVLLGCVQRACQPPVGSREGRSFAVGVLSDVAALLHLGRPVVLTALMDTCRLVEAAKQQLEGSSSSSGGGQHSVDGSRERGSRSKQQLKELRRRLVAAERKLLFFLSWANEQPGELYELLALAAAGEHEKHAAALGSQAAPAAGGTAAAGLAAQLGAVSLGQAGQPAAHARPAGGRQSAAPPVLIEEL